MAIYLGNLAFAETTGSTRQIDPWGMDMLTRKIIGRSDQLTSYLNQFGRSRTVRDTQFPGMYLVDYDVTENGALCNVDLKYRGIINNTTPLPVKTKGYRLQQIQLGYYVLSTTISSGITGGFEYTAPWTRFRYVLNYEPMQTRFPGRVDVTKDGLQIMGRTGPAGKLNIWKGRSLNTVGINIPSIDINGALAAYNAVVESFTTEFNCEQVGQWWACEELNEARFTPLDLANAKTQIAL